MRARRDDPYRGDPLFSLLLGRWRIGEVGFGGLTALAGFGVLSAWHSALWLLDPATRALRGMHDYYSATFGDAILLPLLGAAAAHYAAFVAGAPRGATRTAAAASPAAARLVRLVRRHCRRRAALVFALAIVTAAVALEHLDEVYGSDRNWTVPVRGQPRLVAFYHQAFFGFEAYVIAFLLFRHLVTVRLLRRLTAVASGTEPAAQAERSLRLFARTLFGWGVFASLRVMDFSYLAPTPSIRGLLAFPAPTLVLLVYYAVAVVGGLWPLLLLRRPLADRAALRGLRLLVAAAFVVPVLPPLAWILAGP